MRGPVTLAFTGDVAVTNGNIAATGLKGRLIAPWRA